MRYNHQFFEDGCRSVTIGRMPEDCRPDQRRPCHFPINPGCLPPGVTTMEALEWTPGRARQNCMRNKCFPKRCLNLWMPPRADGTRNPIRHCGCCSGWAWDCGSSSPCDDWVCDGCRNKGCRPGCGCQNTGCGCENQGSDCGCGHHHDCGNTRPCKCGCGCASDCTCGETQNRCCGQISLRRVSRDGCPLYGAIFDLINRDCQVLHSAMTGRKGMLEINGICPGKYTLRESVTPAGHSRVPPVCITVAENCQVFVGDCRIEGTITLGSKCPLPCDRPRPPHRNGAFTFVTETPRGRPVYGAQFALEQEGRAVYIATSDTNGIVSFEDIAPGTYTLRETYPAHGCIPSKHSHLVHVCRDGVVTIDERPAAEFGPWIIVPHHHHRDGYEAEAEE